MDSTTRKKFVDGMVKELRSSFVRSGDVDWHLGFKPDAETPVEETERDPKTGKILNNTKVGDFTTFLNQWDADNTGYVEGEERDSGTYSFELWKSLFEPYGSTKH